MERIQTRVDKVRYILDKTSKEFLDEEQKRCAYVHLYGVGLKENAELLQIAGMLHYFAFCEVPKEAYELQIISKILPKSILREAKSSSIT